MPRLVCVGVATLDTVAVVAHRPEPDQRVLTDELVYSGGGPAATAAVTAARLGEPVSLVAAVGDDAEGHRIIDGLRAENVDVAAIQVEPGRKTGAAVVICEQDTATRTIYNRPTPPLRLRPESIELIRSAEWVHVDHMGWPAVAEALAGTGRRPRISVDHGSPITGTRPDIVDLYVPSAARLVEDHGQRPVRELLEAVNAPVVVATLGSAGSVARDDNGAYVEVPGFAVDVVSTLGAGDVFHGALVTAVCRGMPLCEAMRYANAAAAMSCRAADGRSAIPTHDDVSQFLEAAA